MQVVSIQVFIIESDSQLREVNREGVRQLSVSIT